jgi:DNA replication initiation complex subunit (GINS family)
MLSYQELLKIRAQEKMNNELQPLPQDFFPQLKELLKSLTGKELENTKKLANEIIQLRKSKIFIYLSLNKTPENLTEKEKELYKNITKELEEYNKQISLIFEEKEKTKKVEILKDIPKIVIGEKEFGPCKKGESLEVEEELAELLVKKGIAKFQ